MAEEAGEATERDAGLVHVLTAEVLSYHVGGEHEHVGAFVETLRGCQVADALYKKGKSQVSQNHLVFKKKRIKADFSYLVRESGRAHDFNDVERRPANVVAEHFELSNQIERE